MSLKGKHIVLGITGGIAAYKIPYLVRLLKKARAEVRVMMTPSARQFVTPLTLSSLSQNPVISEFHTGEQWNNHVEWARWADAMMIAPLTANTLAKLSSGQADNFLVATVMSSENVPVFLAPAMDREMWRYPAVKKHVEKLESYGFKIIPPAEGALLSGLEGQGRMPEPEELFNHLKAYFSQDNFYKGKKILITGGPTYEPLDPVRFIGNRSSGKMGWALAQAAHEAGADVILVTGPSPVVPRTAPFKVVRVETAREMFEAFKKHFPEADIAILSAAVSDYRPVRSLDKKMKKSDNPLIIELEPTEDILAYAGHHKNKHQKVIGFALETDNEISNARDKLRRKKADMIVLNSLRDAGAGFQGDTNKVYFIKSDSEIKETPLKSKHAIAKDILNEIKDL